MLKTYFALNKISSIIFIPRTIFGFSLSLYASKHSASNHKNVKVYFIEMNGVCLSMRGKLVFLQASHASSGSVQYRIVSSVRYPIQFLRHNS